MRRPAYLASILDRRLTLDDLKALAFELGLEWENIEGATRNARAHTMVARLAHEGRLGQLERYLEAQGILPASDVANPYRGLRAFREEDSALFFGRAALVDSLVKAVARDRLLVVIGASGSGKSSVVAAGLLPALRRGALPGSEGWLLSAIVRPGEKPMQALAAELARLRGLDEPGSISRLCGLLASRPATLLDEVRHLLAQRSAPSLLLVLDQFEELWSLAPRSEREPFLHTLLASVPPPVAAMARDFPLRVLLVLRADFYSRLLELADFGRRATSALHPVMPMEPDELRQAIVEPANEAGGSFESGLVEELVGQVEGRAGALPLLQDALTTLWERRTPRDEMSWESYLALGKVEGALGLRAEELLVAHYTPEAQGRLRPLLRAMVQPGKGATPDTRRRVRLVELLPTSELEAARHLLEPLIVGRLVTVDHEGEAGESIELTHEALIEKWSTLRRWLDEDREELRLRRELEEDAQRWLAAKREPSFLLRGAPLAHARAWQERAEAPPPAVTDFLDASEAARRAAIAERGEARRRELELARGAARARGAMVLLLSLLLVATGGFILWRDIYPRWQAARLEPLVEGIEVNPVTNERWALCVRSGHCVDPPAVTKRSLEPQAPITGIDAYDASDFCAWIGRTLPKEDQWHAANHISFPEKSFTYEWTQTRCDNATQERLCTDLPNGIVDRAARDRIVIAIAGRTSQETPYPSATYADSRGDSTLALGFRCAEP